MSIESPRLVITNAAGQQQTFLLDKGKTWKIGRDRASGIVLADDAASRRHALIQQTEMGEYYLVDVGSRNGTFIHDRRVCTPILLNDGDEIVVGAHKLVFLNTLSPAARDAGMMSALNQMSRTRVLFAERLVTVLIIDIRGFTVLTQQIGKDVLCKFISRWFSDASAIFRANGSWALKYIGDAVMAAWLHEGADDHAPVLSALTSIAEFAALSSAARYSLPVPLGFGAGLNTGMASIGNAGSGEESDFTAFGEAVNAAFRIEAATRRIAADIAVGQHTVALLGGPASVTPHLTEHCIDLKGYDAPVQVWAGSFISITDLCKGRQSRH